MLSILAKKLFNQQEELKHKSAEEAKQISEKSLIIAKIEWVENNSISQIETKGQRVSLLTQQREEAKDSYTNTDGKIRSLIAQTKEIASFAFLEKKKQSLLNQLANAKSKKESLLKEIESLSVSIDDADIEIKKHQSYKELLAELNKFMPAPFIQKKLDEKTVELNGVQQQMDETQDKINENETIISRRSRNAFSSFFSRSTIQQAEAQLTELRNKQDDLRLEIESISLLKQNYENQLIQRSALQKQADDIHPNKSIDYWRSELSRLSQRKNLAMQERSTCDKEITQNSAELEEVNSKLTVLSPIVEEVNKLKSQLEKEKARYDQAATSLASCTEDIQKLIDLEFDTYGTFHERRFDRESVTEQIITLRKIYDETAMDVRYQDQEKLRIELAEHRKNISRINEELKSIAEKIADLERQAIHQAKIIGATLTKTYLSDVLQEMKFDTVILDEASMAPIPALWCASMLAERNIIIVGDFLQLPPIVMATTPIAAKWLGRDIFAASGIQEKAKKENQSKPLNFVMLDEQFRMEKEIADIANIYYGDYALLRSTSQNSEKRNNKRSEFYKWYKGPQNRSVEIVDTSEMHAWVTSIPRGGKTSRLNCFSAALVVEMAFQWIQDDIEIIKTTKIPAKKPKILIVAPYRPHIDRVNQLVQFEYARRGVEDANLIKAGTIHSFQGSEADIVIFDLVLDEPHWKANLFLQDKDVNDELRKQFNVAVTRAIFKLFIVGNIKYCKKNAKDNALGQFLEHLTQQKFPVTNAKKAFPDLLYAKPRSYSGNGLNDTKHIICREDSFYDYFVSDITHFKEILIIYSPFITNNRISMLLPYFHDAILSGKKIVVVTKAHEDRKKRELDQYKKLENELISIGVEIIHKKGMHEKLVFVDDSAVWMGSLNALSFSGETGEIMHRHCDRAIAAEYKKNL